MGGVGLRLRVRCRTAWRGALTVGVLAGIVIGVVFAIGAGTRRTSTAPDRYTEAYGGDPDLVLFEPASGAFSLADTIDGLPDVSSADSITFVTAFPLDVDGNVVPDPLPFAGNDDAFGARLVSGRFTHDDAPDEFTVNPAAARAMGVAPGDRVRFSSFTQAQADRNDFFGAAEGPAFSAEVTGVVASPADFDDPSPTLVFSPSFLAAHRDIGRIASIIEVRVAPGVDPAAVLDEVRALPGGDGVFQDDPRIVGPDTRRAIRFQTTALWIVTSIAALSAVVVIAQLLSRHFRSVTGDRDSLDALGYRHRDRQVELVAEAVAIAVVASAVAVAVGYAGSALFPLAPLRDLEPNTGPRVDLVVVAVGSMATLATLVASALLAGSRRGWRTSQPTDRVRLADVAGGAGASPALVTGVRFALGAHGRRRSPAALTVAGIALGLAGLSGSLVVGGSLVRVGDDSARWGANFDEFFGNPFLPAPGDIVTPVLDEPAVAALTAATSGSLAIDGTDVGVLAFEALRGGLLPVVLEGRVPTGPDEIALGRVIARHLDRRTGDVVQVVGPDARAVEATVVGYVTTTETGGEGAAMTFGGYAALVPDATKNLLMVNFREGASEAAKEHVATVSVTPPSVLSPPPSVVALDRLTAAPFALAAILAVLSLVALVHALVVGVRHRRRDLAVLRALGADRRQLAATVFWQASCVAVLATLIGLPLGVLGGRLVFQMLADNVGIVREPVGALWLVGGLTAAVLVVANVAATVPAWRASRTGVAELFHDR